MGSGNTTQETSEDTIGGSRPNGGKRPPNDKVVLPDYADPLFAPHSVNIWRVVCSFLGFEDVLTLTLLNKGFNSALIFRTFLSVKLTSSLSKEDAKAYLAFILEKFSKVEELNGHGFKYKKLANLMIFKLPNLKRVVWRMNTALLVKILPGRSNVTEIETSLRGMGQYAELMKLPQLEKLSLTEIDESTPVQKLLMQCPNLRVLELCGGWARNYPTLTHHKVQVVRARRTGDGSQFIDFKSKMANHLDDYFPSCRELYDVSGNSFISSQTLEVFKCAFYRTLNETIDKCPQLRKIIAYSASIDPDKCNLGQLVDVEFNKVKIKDLPKFFKNTPKLERAIIRNIRLENYPLDNKSDLIHCPMLKKLHLEVEHSYPSEDLSLLIKGMPRLEDFTMRYIPRKKLTYDEVLKVIEVKRIVLKHVGNSQLGRFTLIEGFHRDYPIYYEVGLKETFKYCKSLKTIVLVTLPLKKRRGLKKHLYDKFKFEKKRFAWVCDRRVFLKKPLKKLKKAEQSKEKEKEHEIEKEKRAKKEMEMKFETVEENEEDIEEEEILRKAEDILNKSEINQFDEYILSQADEIMNKRKEKMRKLHEIMQRKRSKKKSKRASKAKRKSKSKTPQIIVEEETINLKERVGSKIKAGNNWGLLSSFVGKSSETLEDLDKGEKVEPTPEDLGLDLSFFKKDNDDDSYKISVDSIVNTPAMTPNTSGDNLAMGELTKETERGSDDTLDFSNILGALRGELKKEEAIEKKPKKTKGAVISMNELTKNRGGSSEEIDKTLDFQNVLGELSKEDSEEKLIIKPNEKEPVLEKQSKENKTGAKIVDTNVQNLGKSLENDVVQVHVKSKRDSLARAVNEFLPSDDSVDVTVGSSEHDEIVRTVVEKYNAKEDKDVSLDHETLGTFHEGDNLYVEEEFDVDDVDADLNIGSEFDFHEDDYNFDFGKDDKVASPLPESKMDKKVEPIIETPKKPEVEKKPQEKPKVSNVAEALDLSGDMFGDVDDDDMDLNDLEALMGDDLYAIDDNLIDF